MNVDPRPSTRRKGADTLVEGVRCSACGHAVAFPRPRCPRCRGKVEAATFGPSGVIWASTIVRVPVPGRTPPYGLAYVDLDDGPRILAHVAATGADTPVAIGTDVRLTDRTADGDVQVEVTT